MTYPRDPNIPSLSHHTTPYKPSPTRLQTLDIWLPQHPASTPGTGTWLIYVHGGAWRDPTQDSLCAVPTLHALVSNHANLLHQGPIAGIASLNYRLSPYPTHATAPSAPDDEARTVTHPSHAEDVRDALAYLCREYKIQRWIGIGHSCGATLLLQLPLVAAVHDGIRETLQGLVLLAGIYDIPAFLSAHAPPHCPENIATIYAAIVAGAFGKDEEVYGAVSPARSGKGALWGRYVVLGYGGEDELVEGGQREVMLERYGEEGWVRDGEARGEKVVEVRDLTMGHDEVWEDGGQVAELIAEVVAKVGAR
ncbi:alpha/beta-hydrolase [Karstenula rhodostoma CBS 690.94]|uniref:Kynurenine formamidase n=1 Tax=Karstenula rhodostoma CBS 690.94 TaxID=1392251 RepID=A0A9P4PPR6_9PLEO|nr:alpha/beta-hydrolase [Karstenula rhodostoma CBS 690.94]